METGSILQILSLAVLVLLSAYFSATETAFSSVNRIRLKNMAEDGNRKAALALSLTDQYDNLLSTILIGNNIVNIAAASLATVLFTRYFGNAGVTLSTVVMTVVVLIFGEVSPKSMAKESPERFCQFSAPIVRVLNTLLTPLNFLFRQWKKLLRRIFKPGEERGITEDELITIVDEAQSEGGIGEHEGELIRAAIEFSDLTVEDVFTPRVDVEAVAVDSAMQEISDLFLETGFSRLPVYDGTVDNIIGIVHEKDFYRSLVSGRQDIADITEKILCTTLNTNISVLLRQLQHAKAHMAVVVDEYGGTAGIVTMEDILEELVGDIWDEHEEVIEEFRKVGEGRYVIQCTANLEDMFELLGLDDEYDSVTVSGWVFQELGHVPRVGDTFVYEDLRVLVTKTDARRVLEIEVEVEKGEDGDAV